MDLTLIIPTRDRRAILCETLARLERQTEDVEFEAIVVDDGSRDDTAGAVERLSARSALELTLVTAPGSGPATARNRGLAEARAPVCLFLDDDTWPRAELLRRHRDFHRAHPEPEAAMLGSIVIAPEPPPTPFMCWLAGLHLGYDAIEDPENAGGAHFYSGNVSAKTELVRSAGGFDEGFRAVAHDDIDLGLRLERRGMRLVYNSGAVVEHYQPTDLPRTIKRMHDVGGSLARFAERYPDHSVARRPGLRHRAKAAALTTLTMAGVRTPGVQRETWRFLCHEAAREGFWDAIDADEGRRDAPGTGLRIGRRLARLASRDADAQLPAEGHVRAGRQAHGIRVGLR
jgi:glycosyltransferase involved in cell wall biosynthesis